MSFFNEAQIIGMTTGKYLCPKCGAVMDWENENQDVLICPKCGYDVSLERYGFSDEEYGSLYPTKEEVCGYVDEEDDEDEDEYNGESYDEVYGELSDD